MSVPEPMKKGRGMSLHVTDKQAGLTTNPCVRPTELTNMKFRDRKNAIGPLKLSNIVLCYVGHSHVK